MDFIDFLEVVALLLISVFLALICYHVAESNKESNKEKQQKQAEEESSKKPKEDKSPSQIVKTFELFFAVILGAFASHVLEPLWGISNILGILVFASLTVFIILIYCGISAWFVTALDNVLRKPRKKK